MPVHLLPTVCIDFAGEVDWSQRSTFTFYHPPVQFHSVPDGSFYVEIKNPSEEIDQEVENFLKNESNVGEVNLETWEEIIEEIKMCKVLTLSEKKEEIWKVIEARQKCLFAWNTENLK